MRPQPKPLERSERVLALAAFFFLGAVCGAVVYGVSHRTPASSMDEWKMIYWTERASNLEGQVELIEAAKSPNHWEAYRLMYLKDESVIQKELKNVKEEQYHYEAVTLPH